MAADGGPHVAPAQVLRRRRRGEGASTARRSASRTNGMITRLAGDRAFRPRAVRGRSAEGGGWRPSGRPGAVCRADDRRCEVVTVRIEIKTELERFASRLPSPNSSRWAAESWSRKGQLMIGNSCLEIGIRHCWKFYWKLLFACSWKQQSARTPFAHYSFTSGRQEQQRSSGTPSLVSPTTPSTPSSVAVKGHQGSAGVGGRRRVSARSISRPPPSHPITGARSG